MDRTKRNPRKNQSNRQNKSLHKLKLETEILREELNHGVLLVNRIHKERVRLVNAIEQEIDKQADLRERIAQLKAQYSRLQKNLKTNNKLLAKTQTSRVELEQEVQAIKTRAKTINQMRSSESVKNNFAKLMQEVNSQQGKYPKERSVLLTCLKEFIQTMQANEFEDYKWKAKVAQTDETIAGRIQFTSIYITPEDLRRIYKPVITELGARFKAAKIKVETRTRKENGVITCLDMVISVPVAVNTRGLELP